MNSCLGARPAAPAPGFRSALRIPASAGEERRSSRGGSRPQDQPEQCERQHRERSPGRGYGLCSGMSIKMNDFLAAIETKLQQDRGTAVIRFVRGLLYLTTQRVRISFRL